ncbi:ladderlectin-like [Dendronephthya gigantea]|uniref:ladderlectin-like n=1 Tax=Dendronephthya gigantea TaxID=151771 RepID=UPI00106D6217|nr:ladderlectin-like [Dendronephthya gigantea]
MEVHGIRLFFLLLLSTQTSISVISSSMFKLATSGYRLVGHVTHEYSALDAFHCAQKCLTRHPACKSINFNKEKQSHSGTNCELNNAVKSTYPEEFELMRNVNYYEILEKSQDKSDSRVDGSSKAPTCPLNWKEYNGRCYYISGNVTSSSSTARKNCTSQGGDLAVPTNAEENRFIFNEIKNQIARHPYIGLFRVNRENKFETVDGTKPSYKNWGRGEPNDRKGEEDCVALRINDGKWNDVNCFSSRHFVCEIKV